MGTTTTAAATFANGKRLNHHDAAQLVVRYKAADGSWKFGKAVIDPTPTFYGQMPVAGKVLLSDGSVLDVAEFRFAVKVRNVNGYQNWTTDPAEANRALDKARSATIKTIKETGKAAVQESPKHLHTCIPAFLKAKERAGKGGVKSSSYQTAKSVMEAFETVCNDAGVKSVKDITLDHIHQFIASQSTYAESTLWVRIKNLMGFFGSGEHGLVTLGLISIAHFKQLFPESVMRKHFHEKKASDVEYFRQDEVQAMRQAAGELTRDRVMLELGVQLGLRMQEIQQAMWANIDWTDGTYSVRKLSAKENDGEVWTPKTDKSQRVIPMRDDLLQMLREYREKTVPCKDGRIVCNGNGGKYTAIWEAVVRLGNDAGVTSRVYVHKLRDTAITNWVRTAKVDIRTAQQWAGHGSIETTALYLGPADNQTMRGVINAVSW